MMQLKIVYRAQQIVQIVITQSFSILMDSNARDLMMKLSIITQLPFLKKQ